MFLNKFCILKHAVNFLSRDQNQAGLKETKRIESMRTNDTDHDSASHLSTVDRSTEATKVNKILLFYRSVAQCSPTPQYHQAITSILLSQVDLSWKEYVEEVYNQHNQSISSE